MGTKGIGALLASIQMAGGALPNIMVRGKKIEPKKCALPTCEKMTVHNGGYCCAEHCKAHKELFK